MGGVVMRYTFEENGGALVIKFYVLPSGRLRDTLKEFGFKYFHRSGSWVGHKNIDEAKAAVKAWERRSIRLEGKTGKSRQLCINCAKAGHGNTSECPWEREFKPVPGWKALRRDIGDEESYRIYECPLYEKENRHDRPRKICRAAGSAANP